MNTHTSIHDITNKTHTLGAVFWCSECEFTTSGIILPEVDPLKRFCPRCKIILVWCHVCKKYLSSKRGSNPVVCQKCETVITDKNLNQFNSVKTERKK